MEKTPPANATQPPVPPGYPYGYPYPYPPVEDDEIDLREYWRVLVVNKKLIALVAGVATAISLATAFLLTPVYRAEVLLAPATSEKSGGLGALAGQFGDLASLAGINIAGGGDSTEEAIATLKSRALTDVFIKENNLLPVLFEDDWDLEGRTWKTRDANKIPTLWRAYEFFNKKIRTVAADKKSGLVTLAIEWKNADQAALWANELVRRVNRQRQKEAIQEAESSIGYLQRQLAKTTSVEVEQAIYRLIEAQTKNIMVAQAREEYAFKVIDPAVPPEKKAKPKRAFILVLGVAFGLMLGVFVAFIKKGILRK
jgi:uncharacterized protein involved in exopolysaccharide biosynthesis